MTSNFVRKLTIIVFALFFILLHFIFCRFQLQQTILCQWSGYSYKIPVEFPTGIFWSQKHLALDIWDFKNFLCMLNGQKKKHFRLDQNKWIVWGFWTRKFTNPFFRREMWRRNALPTYIGKGPIYHKTLRKVWSGLAVQKIGF